MGYTAIEKVLGRIGGNPELLHGAPAGTLVHPEPDMVMIHDALVMETKAMLDAVGITRVHAADKTMMVSDHDVLYGSPRAAERGAANRRAAKQWGIKNFYDAGRGGHGHIFPMEEGIVLPGMFYFDNDTHATNAGAVGAFGMRMGKEIARVLATGKTWLQVPQSVQLSLTGRLASGVYARDVGYFLARQIKSGAIAFDLDFRVLEFAGDLDAFGLGPRTALCSTATELGAAAVYVPPSPALIEFCRSRAKRAFEPVFPDADAHYEATATIALDTLVPQVALPGTVSNSVDIDRAVGTPIDHAFIGSCGSGMYDDLVVAASHLAGHTLAPGVRLFIVPGSERSTRRLVEDGLMPIFLDAGAMVLPAGCGPCNDAVVGPLASGERSISTATNNNVGRFGPKDAELYLGSPATVAVSAIAGHIADPRAVPTNPQVERLLEMVDG
jgi:3-isopropylmalate/(R)-2-methylmalate dehydratase large subunit